MALLLLAALTLVFPEDTMSNRFSADVPPDFELELVALCRDALSDGEKKCDPVELLSCWNSESGVSATASNAGGWASGIFQLMPDTARGLGWLSGDSRWAGIDAARERFKAAQAARDANAMHVAAAEVSDLQASVMREYRQLSATEQLAWARRYYGAHRGSLTSAAACYVATFLPALLAHRDEPDFVLCAADGPNEGAYEGNKGAFDPIRKGTITVGDLTARINLGVATGDRWEWSSKRAWLTRSAVRWTCRLRRACSARSRASASTLGPSTASLARRRAPHASRFRPTAGLRTRAARLLDETREALSGAMAVPA